MECSRKNGCVNYKKRCFECGAMGDVMNPYPYYADVKTNERKLMRLLNDIPELLKMGADSLYDRKRLVTYLVKNGVRVEECE